MATAATSTTDEAVSSDQHPLKGCFVWVREPGKSIQHQAELLDSHPENGYQVRWTIQNTVQWVPFSYNIEQMEMGTKRQRRRASTMGETSYSMDEEKEKEEMTTEEASSAKQQSPQGNQPHLSQLKQQHTVNKKKNGVASNHRRLLPSNKKQRVGAKSKRSSMDSCSSTDAESSVAEDESRQTSPTSTTAARSPANDPFISSATSDSLWKIHKVKPSKAQACLAKVLQPLFRSLSISSSHHYPMACKIGNLLLFTLERQACWVRRNNEGKQVWTESTIFQQYFFCNVYRELDRGTCYFRSEMCRYLDDKPELQEHNNGSNGDKNNNNNSDSTNPSKEHHHSAKTTPVSPPLKHQRPQRRVDWIQQVVWASFCYRQVNRMERFEDAFHGIPTLDQDVYDEFVRQVRLIQQEENNRRGELEQSLLFTEIHKTPTYDEYIFNLSQLRRDNGWLLKSIARKLEKAKTVQECWKQMERLPGLMDEYKRKKYPQVAWQVACDLLESGCLPLMDNHSSSPSANGEDFCYFGPQAMSAVVRIVAPHYTHGPIDQSVALKVAQELVAKQNALFDAMGLEFPKWVGNSISLKNMEHCMGQYNRYFLVISDTRKQTNSPCHRLMLSRSYLDGNKNCRLCDTSTDVGLFCDSCLNFYCDKCEKENCEASPTNWICGPCTKLKQLRFHN